MADSYVSIVARAVAVFLLVSAPVFASGQAAPDAPSVRLRAGDAVRLEVGDEPALGGDLTVDESGRVLFPLVGLLPVAGRDFEDVRREVGAAFARELRNQPVRITPLLRIAVLGEVRLPGLYPVDPTFTMGDVLSLAGGLGPEADRSRVELVRDGRVIETADALDLGALSQRLRSGDQIVVGRRSWMRTYAATFVGAGASVVVALVTALLLR